jgi:hypothetical protein
MTNIAGVVKQLKKERARLEDQLHRITAAITAFGNVYMHGAKPARTKRTLSAAARRKISLAQKARWAKQKADSQPTRAKRTLSAAARKKIAAAQRARWAKVKRAA